MSHLLDKKCTEYILNNGLKVILHRDNSLPLVSLNIWYRVGSADESHGKSGFAHLFEHMMFQGSQNIPKEMHFRYIQEAGGSLNGSTSWDRTNYYETLPSNALELALWLESDRMGFLLPGLTQEKLHNQIGVVSNERKQRYENQPYGLAWEILFSSLFPPDHPYSWPTIGWMQDILNMKLEDVKDFFRNYYSPSNASLVLGGDIKEDESLRLIEKYFGDIPGNSPPRQSDPPDVKPVRRCIDHYDQVQLTRIYIAWHTDKIFSPSDAPLDILSHILSGYKNSRLYRPLVFEKQTLKDVSAFQYSANLAGVFVIVATLKSGSDAGAIKEEIYSYISKLIKEGITSEELNTAKASIKSSYIYSLQSLDTLVNQLNHYNFYLGIPNSFVNDLKRYELVTEEDVRSAAERFLTRPSVELVIKNRENFKLNNTETGAVEEN